MDDRERNLRLELINDFLFYAPRCLHIRTKAGAIRPFILNKAQQYIHKRLEEQKNRTGKVRAIILKGRQQGCSTYISGRYYHRTSNNFGLQTFILTHQQDATDNLFKMAKRYHEYTPRLVKPESGVSNAKELLFSNLDSGYKIGTAANKSVGRSATIQLFFGSEVAFWENASDHASGILQAVPDAAATEVILESTANGEGNYYHQMWQKAEAGLSEFQAIFVPWYWQEEYTKAIPEDFELTDHEAELQRIFGLTDGQLCFRRYKIVDFSVNGVDGEKVFQQEYPNTAAEAFISSGEDNFISAELIRSARKEKEVEPYGALFVGVDPARFGDDRTAIIRRQGRVVTKLESYVKKTTMEIVGIVTQIIVNENPDKVLVDIGGLGVGIVDRLHELGHKDMVVGVNAGSSPFNANAYYNKRAEMWGMLKKWLEEIPISLPDSDELQSDLCAIKYSIDSNSRLVMEKKDVMKRRGIRSPDCADALCLTFAMPHLPARDSIKTSRTHKAIGSALVKRINARMPRNGIT